MLLGALLCAVVVVLVSVLLARWRSTVDEDKTEPPGSIELFPRIDAPIQSQTIDSVAKQEPIAKQDSPLHSSLQPFRGWKWKTIAFMDVETTGLTGRDRVVTLAIILLDVPTVSEGETHVQITVSAIHRIYNPGRDCDPVAARIHGHSDWILRHQPFFIEEAQEVSEFIDRADLVVCHNAEFDLRFLNRELSKASMPLITAESFCTMEAYRSRYDGSASLNNVIRQLGLKRESGKHGALEDAWLAMNVFFLLNNAKAGFPFSILGEDQRKLQNLRPVPPMPEGDLPPRKRRPRAKAQTSSRLGCN